MRHYEVMVILDPSLEERTVAPVARQVPQRRPQGRRHRREGRHLGPSSPGLRDQEEGRGHLRRRRPDRRAGHRQGARPPAQPQRVGAAHQGHAAAATESLGLTCGSALAHVGARRHDEPTLDQPSRGVRHGRRHPDHRRRQPHRRPRAALHPLGRRGRQLPDRLHAAHVRQADQRVEGRRHRCSCAARSGGRPRRTSPSPSSGACASSCRAGCAARPYETRRARSAPSSRSRSTRSARRCATPPPRSRARQRGGGGGVGGGQHGGGRRQCSGRQRPVGHPAGGCPPGRRLRRRRSGRRPWATPASATTSRRSDRPLPSERGATGVDAPTSPTGG